MLIFSDFECPFCQRFAANLLPTILKDYVQTGKVVVAFRHFPLQNIHKQALRAAEIAECSRQQGKEI
jgi:protein-disulfide isomerase